MVEDIPDAQEEDDGAETAFVPQPPYNWRLYVTVLAVCIVLAGIGWPVLTAFLQARPVDLVPLAVENERRIIDVLPHIGELLSEFAEEMHDEHAVWRQHTKLVRLYPEVEPEAAHALIRRALDNDSLTVKFETARFGLPTVTVSYFGYVTHKLEMETVSPPQLEQTDVASAGPERSARCRIAIIVDDLGYENESVETLFNINAPLTVSVLPQLEHSAELAAQARAHGFEVMLHLPLEGSADAPASAGTLTTAMDSDTMEALFEANLASVPGAVGVNNHQGSTFTTDPDALNRLMPVIKAHGLFFVDSRTSSESIAERVARQHDIPSASNNMFLDNQDDEQYVERRLAALETVAFERGAAIGICHVHRHSAMNVLARRLAELDPQEIEVVPVSELVY